MQTRLQSSDPLGSSIYRIYQITTFDDFRKHSQEIIRPKTNPNLQRKFTPNRPNQDYLQFISYLLHSGASQTNFNFCIIIAFIVKEVHWSAKFAITSLSTILHTSK